ncbi:sister chromatid cohesion protein Pds5p [Monosporozyma servazzii]
MSQITSKTKLKFNKLIISTADTVIPTNELLNRLSDLHEELSIISQETIDLASLDRYSKDLINKKLLKHKDNGIRALVGCCLSDILRHYAPNAPYTDVQLTEIFKLFLSQFEMLGEPDNPYIIQQTYLITKVLEYRSIVLLTDLPTSNKLLEELFEIFYDDRKSFSPKLYTVIAGILGEVISEFDSVPLDVLKLIFNKFLTYNPNDFPKGLGVASNTGYELSLILCDVYSNRISRQLTRYYSEILYQVTKDDVVETTITYESNPAVIKTITKLHKLVVRLWETSPDLVSSVIGYIQHELSSPHDEIRKSATKLVGKLLTVETTGNFLPMYQEVFDAWVLKITDISPEVRMQWVETIPQILSSRNDVSEEISKGLNKTLIDSDVQVRKLSVQVFAKVPAQNIWKNIHELSVYSSLLYLTREKNKDIRDLSILTAGQFYSDSIENITRTSENNDIWEIVDTIPSTLLNLYYINNKFINEEVDRIIFEYILPLETDDNTRTKRLFTVLSHCDDKAFAAFFAFNKRQLQMSLALSKYVQFCEVLNKSDKESNKTKDQNDSGLEVRIKFNKTLEWLSSSLSDKMKALESLKLIKEMNDSRIFFLIKSCINKEASIVTIKNSMKELMMKLKDPGLFRKYDIPSVSTVLPKDLALQIEILLYRASPLIYNVSNINLFLNSPDFADNNEKDLRRRLLDDISNVNPTSFKDQVTKLKDIVHNFDVKKADSSDDIIKLCDTLKTLYKIIKVLKDDVDFDDSVFMTKLKDLAIDGNLLTAKYATKILSFAKDAQELLTNVKNSILPLNIKEENFASHVVILMEILKFHPQILDEDSTEIVTYVIKEVLLANQVTGDIEGCTTDWIENNKLISTTDNKFKSLNSKTFTLKLLTNKLRSIAPDITRDDLSKNFAERNLKLLLYIIASGGELISEQSTENYPTPNIYQTKLRCYAGLQVLKLAKVANLNEFITPSDIIKLVNLVEDECLPVRDQFLETLKTYISNELISIKFLPLIFFTAYEPDENLKRTTKTWINYTVGKQSFKKGTFFERALPRLIHAISHHPDIIEGLNGNESQHISALKTSVDYLIFYFDSIASQENFSLLYYLSERVKNYQDNIEDEEEDDEEVEEVSDNAKRTNSERMYIVGELAQIILLQLKIKRGWQHTAYPGKLNLPNDLFKPFNSIEDAQASFKTYIAESYLETIKSNIKLKVGKIVHTSQTQRQRAQKRLLANEYQNTVSEEQNAKKRKTEKKKNNNDDESEDDDSEDVYLPASNKIVYNNSRKKNLRERKTINYNEDEE